MAELCLGRSAATTAGDLIVIVSINGNRNDRKKLIAHAKQLAASLGYAEIKLCTNKLFAENLTFHGRLGHRVEREEDFMGGICVHMNKTVSLSHH